MITVPMKQPLQDFSFQIETFHFHFHSSSHPRKNVIIIIVTITEMFEDKHLCFLKNAL